MSNARGFTLIEILVSVAIFAVIVIGAIGVLGAADAGGFLEGFPTGTITARVARDITAATVLVQAFQEFAATTNSQGLIVGSYCDGPDCTGPAIASSGLSGYPLLPTESFQLDWRKLEVIIQRWYWDDTLDTDGPGGPDKGKMYCKLEGPNVPSDLVKDPNFYAGCGAINDTEVLVRLNTKLTWRLRNTSRTLEVDRFLP